MERKKKIITFLFDDFCQKKIEEIYEKILVGLEHLKKKKFLYFVFSLAFPGIMFV